MLDNLMCSSLALLAQTIIYGVNACNNAIEVSVGLKGLVANLVFRSRQSLPLQREVWRDCLYGRGLFRETHKKRIALCYPSCVERKTRVCPSAPHSVYQAIAFAQYYTPNSRDTWVVSGCRFRGRLLPYKLQNYSCLRQIYE